ncbi:MAG: 50S ribosomal protein L11 methyltransferase [Kiritimatiellae bacterium]|jgi:ribosomal protein L11 methyltransferase|nr:50S ribosomal protein L11 methyltransferase [Kiritimatiellia bacterium]
MSDVQDLWILSIPARNPREAEGIRDWLENACDASPVELELVDQAVIWLEAYFESEVEARLLSHAFREQFPEAEALVRHCGAKDWTTFWQHHFHPVEVGKSLFILPEWLREKEEVPEGREVILINPGLSFGTGNHFTTHFCLKMIDRLHLEGFKPETMLDAGCGSAILSVAARKFGWDNILAVDFDPMALKQAAENLVLNGIEDGIRLEVKDLTRTWFDQKFQLLAANLYGGLLMELAPKLVRACSGTMILSGIRTIEADAVATIFGQLGAVEKVCEADHEWCGMLLDCSSET